MLPRYGTIASAASLVLFGKCLSDEYSKYLFLRSGVSFEQNLDTVDISFCVTVSYLLQQLLCRCLLHGF